LDDFAKDTICRQLTCEHVYHGPCIDLWLSNHEVKFLKVHLINVNKNCPNCKKEMTRQAIEEHLANPNKPTFENKLHLPAEGEAPKHEDTYANHTTTNNRYRRSDSGMSEINSSSACLKTNKTPREEFHYNNYNSLNASIQNYQPEMIVEFEDVQEARQSRVPIRQINATVQKVIQRSPDYNQR